jgi:hypothetical protein
MRSRAVHLALALVLTACGPIPDLEGSDGGSDAGTHVGVMVRVTYEAQSEEVDLTLLDTVQHETVAKVRLSAVVHAGYPELQLDAILADFVASDGFTPGSSFNCDGLVPVYGLRLEDGYLDPETRNLSWDQTLSFPGCMYVDDTEEIQISDQ